MQCCGDTGRMWHCPYLPNFIPCLKTEADEEDETTRLVTFISENAMLRAEMREITTAETRPSNSPHLPHAKNKEI